MMAKKTNHNTTRKKPSNYRPLWADVKSVMGYASARLTNDQRDAIFQDFWEWVQLPTSKRFSSFYRNYGIPRKTFEDIINYNPKYKFIHDIAREILGDRREDDLLAVAPYKIEKTLHLYNADWHQVWEQEKEIRLKEKSEEKEIHVHLSPAESTPQVPEKE